MLTIGELAKATGVATSALRYWESLGLLAPTRVHGQRRYDDEAVTVVGGILLLRDAGYTLDEAKVVLSGESWRELAKRKLDELDEQIAKIQAARRAVAHSLGCPHDDLRSCPVFLGGVTARLGGASLADAHPH
jgi:DNA-binding transcriptional MerR regulator